MKSSSRSDSTEQFFATCPRGLEASLATELSSLGGGNTQAADGGVAFAGTLETMYRCNLGSRIASRILWRIGGGRYRNEEDLYRAANALDWQRFFPVECTLRVNIAAIASPLTSLEFATLRIKDAICDRFRADLGRRPDVDTANPDVRIHAFLNRQDYSLYLDTSGDALFKRGYRREAGEAPLRENLAAGILQLSGWHPSEPLFDPMCGSGTFLIEAARMASGIAPGAGRAFGFERLMNFDQALWTRVRDDSKPRRDEIDSQISGSDIDALAVQGAARNFEQAGVAGRIRVAAADILTAAAPADHGVMVMNPPYGVRLEQDAGKLALFYPRLGDALKKNFAGWRAYIFTGDLRLPKLIGLAPSKRTPLFNGAIECRLYEFKLVSGSMRKK